MIPGCAYRQITVTVVPEPWVIFRTIKGDFRAPQESLIPPAGIAVAPEDGRGLLAS
jgi:hypothetical protein